MVHQSISPFMKKLILRSILNIKYVQGEGGVRTIFLFAPLSISNGIALMHSLLPMLRFLYAARLCKEDLH